MPNFFIIHNQPNSLFRNAKNDSISRSHNQRRSRNNQKIHGRQILRHTFEKLLRHRPTEQHCGRFHSGLTARSTVDIFRCRWRVLIASIINIFNRMFYLVTKLIVVSFEATRLATRLSNGTVNGHNFFTRYLVTLSVKPVDVLSVHASQFTRLDMEQLRKTMRQRRLPPPVPRAENERSSHFQVRELVPRKHFFFDYVSRIGPHEASFLGCGSDEFRAERGVHSAGGAEVGYAGGYGYARTGEYDD
mmetsp:Transcript_10987/g.13628  ORF Transcript_10987/g.13628 Transcript_10987/m.13628 type:complete len:246 (-) Transcript_10987:151-888(-)